MFTTTPQRRQRPDRRKSLCRNGARVAELADALDLGSSPARGRGSNPRSRTARGKARLDCDALQKFIDETELDWGYRDDVTCNVYAGTVKVLSISVGAEGPGGQR